MGILSLLKNKRQKTKYRSETIFQKSGGDLSGRVYDNGFDSLVLIGTVKNREQFDICLTGKFYYIPLRLLREIDFGLSKDLHRITHVSLYQSIAQYKDDAGIKYIGKVEKFSVVKRNQISEVPKNSKELYVYFEISEWQERTEKIKVSEIGIYPFMIVPFGTFKAAKETAELTIPTTEGREVFRTLKQLSTDVNLTSFSCGEYAFFDENDTLVVFYKNQCVLQLPMEVIREIPYSGYEAIKEAIKLYD